MKKKMRIILFILLGLMLVVNVSLLFVNKSYDKKFGDPNTKDYFVRYISTNNATDAERNLILDYAGNEELNKYFYFALIDAKNDTMKQHVQTYKITGAKATVITDSSGDKVYSKHSGWLDEAGLKEQIQKMGK